LPQCPDGSQHRMERQISRFAFTGKAREPGPAGEEAAPDPRQEAAMMQIASEIESMGEANPDPKTLGRLMRKMEQAMGEKLPGEMEEMIGRLEKGEDPEKLEEDFGHLMDEADPATPAGAPDAEGKARRRRRSAPERDPTLYEMADFLK